eukprot:CAMPEP_0119062806 /NCGR_PEP_ID=MMETSP1178-20130426/6316_1 /TAXON_ID=33656 /ORGANISM="unid sp, Strain CCMP2000" /LENGTH=261 /DNA_ID=CAMNT_0007044113 /DNA_START=43 /DNA_END=828 /DNA_ORIENTATION=-
MTSAKATAHPALSLLLLALSDALRLPTHLNGAAALGALPTLTRRAALGGTAALCALPAAGVADGIMGADSAKGFGPYGEALSELKQGDAARMGFSIEANDAVARNALTGGGTPLYNSAAVDLAKVDAITKRWATMIAGVRKSLTNEKGSTAANAAAAKAAIDNGMGSLKQDMRSVAKALAGGDVQVRETQTRGGGATATFDYATGQFALKPIAEKPEAIFKLITDCYVNDLKTSSSALAKVAEADALFAEWLAAVRGMSKA